MRINFLTGSLALRQLKTGVHIMHDCIIKQFQCHNDASHSFIVSCYSSEKALRKKYPQFETCEYRNHLRFSSKMVRMLAYLLPIELFFGQSDLYLCDGMVPHTIHKAKKVAVVHDLMVKRYPENYGLIRKLYLNAYFRSCRRADRILAVSECTKNDIIDFLGYPEEQIDVIRIGYTKPLENVPHDCNDEELRTQENARYLLYIGDMRKNKNLINAIKAFEIAHAHDKRLRFKIAGSKSGEYSNLAAYVKERGLSSAVDFMGYVSGEEKIRLYENAFALLFVSEYEGFGLPIIEAANYKVPVITSNTSSMREIAAGYCLLVDPHDPDAIAQAIFELNDDAHRLNLIEKQSYLTCEYTWEHSYEDICAAFEKLGNK